MWCGVAWRRVEWCGVVEGRGLKRSVVQRCVVSCWFILFDFSSSFFNTLNILLAVFPRSLHHLHFYLLLSLSSFFLPPLILLPSLPPSLPSFCSSFLSAHSFSHTFLLSSPQATRKYPLPLLHHFTTTILMTTTYHTMTWNQVQVPLY